MHRSRRLGRSSPRCRSRAERRNRAEGGEAALGVAIVPRAMATPPTRAPATPKRQFKRWLSAPPRPHGEILKDRTVSNLELFYDLAYVAVIAQAAHHLAEHVSLQGFIEFAVVFSML